MMDHQLKLDFSSFFFWKPENLYDGIELELASMPPDLLMLGDECLVADHYEGEIVNRACTLLPKNISRTFPELSLIFPGL